MIALRFSRRVALLAVAFAVIVLLAAAPSAGAGTYTVQACTNGSLSGWSHFNHGLWSLWEDSCGLVGGGMRSTVWTEPGSASGWTFTAPADTEIAGFRLTRSYALPASWPNSSGAVATYTDGFGPRYLDWRPNGGGPIQQAPELLVDADLRGQTTLTTSVQCIGSADCSGGARATVHEASIDLRDDVPPTISTVEGSLIGGGSLKGTRELNYWAADRGGGIRREALAVDGQTRAERTLHCSLTAVVPCPLTSSGTLALDTTRLADGEHQVELSVWDATLENRARRTFDIHVENPPAPTPTPTPTATAIATAAATAGPALVQPASQPSAPSAETPLLAVPSAGFAPTGQTSITVRWGARPRIVGTLLRPDGRPVAHARLTVTSQVRSVNAGPMMLAGVITDADGRFSYLVPSGLSRHITFVYRDASGPRTATVTIAVIPRVTLRYARSGTVSGRVSGAPAGVRRLVELQTPRGGTWRTFAVTRLSATGGTFSVRPGSRPSRVRAVIRTDPTWPFAAVTTPAIARPRR